MDAILAALAAGAGAGLQGTASAAIQDSYQQLKQVILRCAGNREDLSRALESPQVDADLWQQSVSNALQSSGVDGDPQVLAATRQLLALVAPEKANAFKVDIGVNHGAVGEFSGPVTFNQGRFDPPQMPEAT